MELKITFPTDCAYLENFKNFLVNDMGYKVDTSDTPITLVNDIPVNDNPVVAIVWNYLWARYHMLPLTPHIDQKEYEAAVETLYVMEQ